MAEPSDNAENRLPPPVPTPDIELRARAILTSTDRQVLTFVRETDTRDALAEGLQQYLEDLSITWAGGRELRFVEVRKVWSVPEEPAKYPSAAIVADAPAEYEAAEMVPELEQVGDGTGRYLRFVSEMKQSFDLVIWATDPKERAGLVTMVQDAMNPAEFMTGLRLELPQYFGLRATYEPMDVFYDDDGESAQRRWRRAIMTISANVPVAVPVGAIPTMSTQTQVHVTDGSAC